MSDAWASVLVALVVQGFAFGFLYIKQKQTHDVFNSRMSELIVLIKAAAFDRGFKAAQHGDAKVDKE